MQPEYTIGSRRVQANATYRRDVCPDNGSGKATPVAAATEMR